MTQLLQIPERDLLVPVIREPFGWLAFQALPPEVAAVIASEFPPPHDTRWHTFEPELERGKQEGRAEIAGPLVGMIHDEFEKRLTPWLAHSFEIPDLQPDPLRIGSGIHQSGPGARLALHTDFNVHPQNPDLIRAVNVILFLTETQGEGTLELCDVGTVGGIARPIHVVSVPPIAGLLIAFESIEGGYHGHPKPMAEGAPLRRSIPGYWYRRRREGEQIEAHSTRFLGDS